MLYSGKSIDHLWDSAVCAKKFEFLKTEKSSKERVEYSNEAAAKSGRRVRRKCNRKKPANKSASQ